ncbi:hypothetical protein [Streptomyces cadmiisoli]|uniref:hypothetical protein n=1 Tax=Streptomyces cadmiisoli TaxID=2184053 RepID=UPI00364C5CC2
MSNRYLDLRGATGRAAPLVVLRCAALLAVLMWLLPVCAHSTEEAARTTPAAAPGTAPAPAASVPGAAPADSVPGTSVPTASGPGDPPAATDAARAFRAGDVHDCPDREHRPGDTHCRPAAKAVASTASGVPVPPPRATDVTGAGRDGLSPPCRGAPDVLVHTPGIHRLGIQRI